MILFGEHFVVYGAPAIAAGLNNSAIVEVKEANENSIVTNHVVIRELSLKGIHAVLESMGVKKKYRVFLEGDLPTHGGLGSSAAFCVGLARAVAEDIGKNLTDEEVNRHAHMGEKAFHGNPSGIDNFVATYRGCVLFSKGMNKSDSFEFLKLGVPLHLVVSSTGKIGETAKMVDAVRKFKEQDKDEFSQLMDEYMEIALKARHALERGKTTEIGKLMNNNHTLLSELGVSIEENEKIVDISMENGAFGAKLTGGGGGGCCITLAKNEETATEITSALEKNGFRSFYSRIE